MTADKIFYSENDYIKLVSLAQAGDKNALSELLIMVLPLVNYQARAFLNSGTELDDLCQEGMIGVISAVNSYRVDGGASFRTYLSVCVKNRLLSFIAKQSGKSIFSANTISLENDEYVASDLKSLEEQLIYKDECESIFESINSKLSLKERETLRLFLSGLSYEEIAQRTGSSPKSVDNAIQRVRQKLKKYNS